MELLTVEGIVRLLSLGFFLIPLRQFPRVSLLLPQQPLVSLECVEIYPLPLLNLVLSPVYELSHLIASSTHRKMYHQKKAKIIFRYRSLNYQESPALLAPSNVASLVDQIWDSGKKKMRRKILL